MFKIKTSLSFIPLILSVSLISGASAEISTVGLIDYFDPNSGLVTNEGGQVSAWTNLADSTRSVTAVSEATSVVVGPNGSTLIRFDSAESQGHLAYPSPGDDTMSGGYTIFVVAELDPLSSNPFPRAHTSNTDSHAVFYRNDNGRIDVKANPLGGPSRPGSAFDGGLTILTARLSPERQELFFNGNLVSSSNVSIGDYDISNGEFRIGNSWKGRIGHVLVYDSSPTLKQLGQTGESLAESYGLSWNPGVLNPFNRLEISTENTYINEGEMEVLTIPYVNSDTVGNLIVESPVAIEGPDAAYFTVDFFDSLLTPGTSGEIRVAFDPTLPNGGPRSYQATLRILSNDTGNPMTEVSLEVNSYLAGLTYNQNPQMALDLAGYSTNASYVRPGLSPESRGMARVKGAGDPVGGGPDTLYQGAQTPDGFSDWQLDFQFSPVDLASWSDRSGGSQPNGLVADRSFQMAVLATDFSGSQYGGNEMAATLINLAYLPAGGGETVGSEGFYLYDGTAWVHVPGLGTVQGSIDIDSDDDASNGVGDGILNPADGDTVNAYRVLVTGQGFGEGEASFGIRLSGGELTVPREVAGLTVFHALDGDSSTPAGYMFIQLLGRRCLL